MKDNKNKDKSKIIRYILVILIVIASIFAVTNLLTYDYIRNTFFK